MKRPFFVALVTGAFLAVAVSGHAAIIWSANQNVAIPTTPDGIVIDLLSGEVTPGDDAVGANVGFFFGGLGISNDADSTATMPSFQPVRVGTDPLDSVANLTVGVPVDGSSTFAVGTMDPNPFGGSSTHLGTEFTAGDPGYLGFSLDSGGSTVYGWMRVTLEANTSAGTVHEWAYEDSGAAIAVGAIPEPGSSALAALAFASLVFRRRRN